MCVCEKAAGPGFGQPFEVVTAGGRVATVLSIAVALIVVPGQLAKLATVAQAQNMMEGMMKGMDPKALEEAAEKAQAQMEAAQAANGK